MYRVEAFLFKIKENKTLTGDETKNKILTNERTNERTNEQLSLFDFIDGSFFEPVVEKRFKDNWFISKVDYQNAMNLVVKNHYMHRPCPCSVAYGLINQMDEIDGVITYGVPCSSTLLRGICGDEEQHNVYELNRLWIADYVPKNAESFLVGNTLKLLDKEIIVSFSDTSVGHVGYIYQATNFLYCGLSARFTDLRVRGFEGKHHSTFGNRMSFSEMKEKYGEENCYIAERPRKHRYVYFNAKGKRRKELLAELKYPILDYPKGDTTRHSTEEIYGY